MIERSAAGAVFTVVWAVAVLLAGAGSRSAALMVAESVRRPAPAGAVTWIVIVRLAPTAMAGRVQVTTPPDSPQVHPVPPAFWKTTPGGSVLTTETVLAGSGPALLAVSV